MGIKDTDQAALAKLRALSAEEVLGGAPARAGASVPSYETTPILDGKLITETAETAYKARRQPRVPLMLGSNSADTAGNRIKATTKEQLFARFGQWSAQAKAAYDPDGSTDLATLISRANDDFGQAEPSRRASQRVPSRPTVCLSICAGSPTFRLRCGKCFGPAHRTAAKLHSCSAHWVLPASGRHHHRRHPRIRRSLGWRKATGSTSPSPAIQMARDCRLGRVTIRARS